MKIRDALAALLALTLGVSAAPALADESFFESFGKAAGLISAPPDPPDFVKATRPNTEPTPMPVFATPDEPRSKVKTPAELKQMDADLDRASRRQSGRPATKTKSPRPKSTTP